MKRQHYKIFKNILKKLLIDHNPRGSMCYKNPMMCYFAIILPNSIRHVPLVEQVTDVYTLARCWPGFS